MKRTPIQYAVLMVWTFLSVRICTAANESPFKLHGRDVHVRTGRYELVLREGVFVYVKNLLTDEVYGDARKTALPADLVRGLSSPSWDKKAFESLQPMFGGIGLGALIKKDSVRKPWGCLCFPDEESAVKLVGKAPGEVIVRYSGLKRMGKPLNDTEFSMHLKVDAKTGDLVVRSIGLSKSIAMGGSAVSFAELAKGVNVIVPHQGGHVFGARWGNRLISPMWPRFWTMGIVIAEFPGGTLSIWADDPELHGKRLFAELKDGGAHISVLSFNNLPYEEHDEIRGSAWRFNVYEGNWIKPASVYKKWMKKTFDLTPLDRQTPAWLKNIRTLYSGSASIEELRNLALQLAPEERSTVLYGIWQGWLHRETNTDKAPDGHRWLPYNPSWGRYKGIADMKEFVEEAHRLGFHVLVFTNLIAINWAHPLLWEQPFRFLQTEVLDPARKQECLERENKRALAYVHQADPEYQRFSIQTLKRLIEDYNIDGVYLDCSSVVLNGIVVNGMNPFQGTVAWHKAVRKALPDLVLLGEQIHEVTLTGEAFALDTVMGWGAKHAQDLLHETVHPINGYLMNDYVNRFRWGEGGRRQDRAERACHIPNRMIDKIRIFGRYQLKYVFPDTWEQNVRSYLRGNDGRLFRFVSEYGSRFEAVDAKGGREVFYWRLHNTTKSPSPGGINQWVGYDSAGRPIGLDPEKYYFLRSQQPMEKLFRVFDLPSGLHINEARIREDCVLLKLGSSGKEKSGSLRFSSETAFLQIGSGSGKPVNLQHENETTYCIRPVESPESFVLFSKPVKQESFPVSLLSSGWTWEMFRNGVGVDLNPKWRKRFAPHPRKVKPNETGPRMVLSAYPYHKAERRIYRIVQLPNRGRPVLSVQYQVAIPGKLTKYADGVHFMVRVNGKELMKELVRNGTEWLRKEFSLEAYRNQPVLVTLATDGHVLGQCDYALWGDVVIRAE